MVFIETICGLLCKANTMVSLRNVVTVVNLMVKRSVVNNKYNTGPSTKFNGVHVGNWRTNGTKSYSM